MLDGMGMIPPALLAPIQLGLPAVELLLAATLAGGWMMHISLLSTVFLSTVFSGVHAFALISGTAKSCGCVGVLIDHASWESHLLLLVLSLGMLCASFALLARVHESAMIRS